MKRKTPSPSSSEKRDDSETGPDSVVSFDPAKHIDSPQIYIKEAEDIIELPTIAAVVETPSNTGKSG